MTYEIDGLTGAEHAEFFGPDWYDEDEVEDELLAPPEGLVHRDTGKPPNQAEWQQIIAHAKAILESPYSAPEQIDWAMSVHPDPIGIMFERYFENPRHFDERGF